MRLSILYAMRKSDGAAKNNHRGSYLPKLASCWVVTHMLVTATPVWGAPIFGEPRAYPVGTSPVGIAVGEFSGTAGLDLVTADEGDTLTILPNSGNGVFQAGNKIDIPGRYTATGIVAGRFNADAIDDIAVSADDTQSFPDFNGSALIYGSTAAFAYGLNPIPVGILPLCITLGDLSGDGIADLVSCGSSADGTGLATLQRGNQDHSFAAPTGIPLAGIIPSRLYVADIDNDSRPDLLVLDTDADAVWILYGSGPGPTFESPVMLATIPAPTAAVFVHIAADFGLDVAVASRGRGSVFVYRQASARTFSVPAEYAVGLSPIDVAAADFDGDSVLDLVVVNNLSNDVMLLLGKSDGTFQPSETVVVEDGPVAIAVADFNGDNKLDFATANQDDETFGRDTQSVSVVLNGVSPPISVTPTRKVTAATATPTPTATPRANTPTPSRTPVIGTPTPTPTPAGPGDANCSGHIDTADIDALVERLFEPGCAAADVNGDGEVTASDLPQIIQLLTVSH